MEYIIIAIIAYLIGSINFSILISKKKAGYDIRQKGSGNAGTTNMLRNLGKKYAAITLICDVLKGVVAIVIAIIVGNILGDTNKALLVQIAGVAVVIGHTFPIFFGFKGGKGVATSLGILLMTNWQLGLICLVFALVLMALTRVVSMGSIAAAILYPILTLFVGGGHYIVESSGLGNGYFIYSVILAVIVIFNHRENIKRILSGTENKISFNK
ncbi:glycerol-3-phosphate acyltransferase [Clostridium sp. CAG:354]|jgi:glycerol-3-phosphate acyltransferase PlsY|nr:glycerol-3-phosphate 1-O-acyltransferase PlsY [Clostridium sp.]MBS5864383.1 glycerol-3-phosphate 1-O-acyltransferase PlsY [Clostridium sp.]MEE0268998.1 glycerol-3-phosphate 1-O-acyltransferase PlsY [Clostridia bacterium]CDE11351.1 glycerol-3-phosphate acyltransferase [Clostridium sp. CAG:354]